MKCEFCGGDIDPIDDLKFAHKGCWQQHQQDRADEFMMYEAYENGEI